VLFNDNNAGENHGSGGVFTEVVSWWRLENMEKLRGGFMVVWWQHER